MTTALIARLRRVEGQVRGIQRMVDEDASCIDLLTQIGAARAALDAAGLALLEVHVRECLIEDGRSADAATELVAAVERFVRR